MLAGIFFRNLVEAGHQTIQIYETASRSDDDTGKQQPGACSEAIIQKVPQPKSADDTGSKYCSHSKGKCQFALFSFPGHDGTIRDG